MIVAGKALDLLNHAEFCPVLPVQKRRDYGQAQLRPTLNWLEPERSGMLWGTASGDRENRVTARQTRSTRNPGRHSCQRTSLERRAAWHTSKCQMPTGTKACHEGPSRL